MKTHYMNGFHFPFPFYHDRYLEDDNSTGQPLVLLNMQVADGMEGLPDYLSGCGAVDVTNDKSFSAIHLSINK